MRKINAFLLALDYARRCGAVVSCDYSYNGFSSDDWDWWTINPEKTSFTISRKGITVDGTFYPWGICGKSFSVCPILSENHIGSAIKTFNS